MNMQETMSKMLAPEDILRGDYVMAMTESVQMIAGACRGAIESPAPRVVTLEVLADEDRGPMRVREVCLPFVLVRDPKGAHKVIDLRRVRLARLSPEFGQAAFKRLAPPGSNGAGESA